MSFSSLTIGASSLYAAQRAAEIAAHNVANASTEGYTKQRLSVTTARPQAGTAGMRGDGMRGTGVQVVSIDRLRDVLADLSVRGSLSTAGTADARAEVLGRAETVLGQYPAGAPAALDRFFAAWDQLSLTPQEPAARSNVLDTGRELATSLNAAAQQLAQISEDVGARMTSTVDEVNALARHVATLNQSVADALTAGQSPNDLLDQRDAALDRLARLTGATVQKAETGQVDVYVGNSVLVAGVSTRPLATTRAGGVTGVAFADGGAAVVGGELGGYARTVAVDLPAFGRQLDEVASQVAAQVNAVHRASYTGRGSTAPDGGDFFSGSTALDLRLRDDLTEDGVAASASGAASDGNAALLMSGLRSGTPGLGELLRGAASRLGNASATSARDQRQATTALAGAQERRQSANGVNVDEEMVDLVKYQHAYEAAARVISMADDFFDVIINRMGAGR